jgi:hypothetical protein
MRAAIAVTHAERLRRIDALADGSASAPALDAAASFPVETFAELRAGGAARADRPEWARRRRLWWEGRYRDYYELLERLARIGSVTAQLRPRPGRFRR